MWDAQQKTLEYFFSLRNGPVDIVLILQGAKSLEFLLEPYLPHNSLLYFQTSHSYNYGPRPVELHGDIHPSREILFFDEDLLVGKSLCEARDYFLNLGYGPKKMSAFIASGKLCDRGGDEPAIGNGCPIIMSPDDIMGLNVEQEKGAIQKIEHRRGR